MTRLDQKLGCDMSFLCELRLLQTLAGSLEIRAGVLAVRIQKQIVLTTVDVIVMCDVAPCALLTVALMNSP